MRLLNYVKLKYLKSRNLKVKWLLCVLLLLVTGFSMKAWADTAIEKSDLARINAILSHLNPLINDAQRNQNPNARVKFCYACLRQDISKIQVGIAQGIHGVSIEPRAVVPLQGDYVPSQVLVKAK